MEAIVSRRDVPELPEEIRIQFASRGSCSGREIADLSAAGVRKIVEEVRSGESSCLMLSLDEFCEEGYLLLESSQDLIFLQIWDEDSGTAWACFDPAYLDSDEEAPIEASDGQSVFPMRNTMCDRELAALCVEWYIHTGLPCPGMDWLKMACCESIRK